MNKLKPNDLLDDTKTTAFEYLQTKVEVLEEQLELIARILRQHNLTYKSEDSPSTEIDPLVWEKLSED